MPPCADCRAIAAAAPTEARQLYPHLRLFLAYDQDEFVRGAWHHCPQCGSVWHEATSTYNTDWGWHWRRERWAEFLRQHAADLPAEVAHTPAAVRRWLATFDGQLYSGYPGP